jgi:hypothetical protein
LAHTTHAELQRLRLQEANAELALLLWGERPSLTWADALELLRLQRHQRAIQERIGWLEALSNEHDVTETCGSETR